MPLRAIYRRAVDRGEVTVNPTMGLKLPAVRGRRDRIASPIEAAALIAALPELDRALWATALYAGLRRDELMALRGEDVDLQKNLITVATLLGREGGLDRTEEPRWTPDSADRGRSARAADRTQASVRSHGRALCSRGRAIVHSSPSLSPRGLGGHGRRVRWRRSHSTNAATPSPA